MANTYSQINIHCVFAVQGRHNFIRSDFRSELFRYMAGIINSDNSYSLAVGGWLDHVHVFFELHPDSKISDQMRKLKATSSKWLNDKGFIPGKFRWQQGYAAFSYSRSQRSDVISYIMNQEEHHQNKSFKEEYLEFLRKFEIHFKDEYLFEFYSAPV